MDGETRQGVEAKIRPQTGLAVQESGHEVWNRPERVIAGAGSNATQEYSEYGRKVCGLYGCEESLRTVEGYRLRGFDHAAA